VNEARMCSPFGNTEVRGARENNLMSYTWAAYGLETVVTWTLTLRARAPTFAWSGRASDQQQADQGANYRLAGVFAALEQVLARID
jgi:hypothetical protein